MSGLLSYGAEICIDKNSHEAIVGNKTGRKLSIGIRRFSHTRKI